MKGIYKWLICLVPICGLLFLNACAGHRPRIPEPSEQPQIEKGDRLGEEEILQKTAPKYVADKTVTVRKPPGDNRNKIILYHDLSCVHVSKIPEENRVYFHNLTEVYKYVAARRIACKDCGAHEDSLLWKASLAAMKRDAQSKRWQEVKKRERRERYLLLGIGCGTSVLVVAGLTAVDRDLAWPATRTVILIDVGVGLLYLLGKSCLGGLVGQS